MIVAIDGPVGVGKSSIAREIARQARLYYLNSGNFYRAITLKHLLSKGDFSNRDECLSTARNARIDIVDGVFQLDGHAVSESELHNSDIDMNASQISSIPEVRQIVNERMKEISKGLDIIAEGRDISTVVFPDADFKFYLDAEPEIRARRRFQQKLDNQTYEEVLSALKQRDLNDMNKPVGALKIAPNAIIINTSYLTIKEVCEKVLNALKRQ